LTPFFDCVASDTRQEWITNSSSLVGDDSMSAYKLFVSVAVLAAAILIGNSPSLAQQKKKSAEVTKEDLVSKVPNFFYFDYPFEPLPGKRIWLRIDDKQFIERYPNGTESKFKILSRGSVDGIQ